MKFKFHENLNFRQKYAFLENLKKIKNLEIKIIFRVVNFYRLCSVIFLHV